MGDQALKLWSTARDTRVLLLLNDCNPALGVYILRAQSTIVMEVEVKKLKIKRTWLLALSDDERRRRVRRMATLDDSGGGGAPDTNYLLDGSSNILTDDSANRLTNA